jgi:HEXXH motif-containing protein
MDRLAPQMNGFRHLTAAEVVADGHSFFWFNVHRLSQGDKRRPRHIDDLVRHFLMMGFDSFFHRLPEGSTVELEAVADSDVLLPRLGVLVEAAGRPAILRKTGRDSLRVEAGNAYEIDIHAIDPAVRLPRLEIPGHPDMSLVLAADKSIFRKSYFPKLAPKTLKAQGLADMIGRALAFISQVLPVTAADLIALIKWYVPLYTPDMRTHNSFSSEDLIGVIFLSEAYAEENLAEAIVHEYLHNQLYLLMEAHDVVQFETEQKYYSPWRTDPRPNYGLIHACHVFSGVADFYAAAEKLPMLSDRHDAFHRNRIKRCIQVRMGLRQIRRDLLPELGQRLVDAMEDEVAEHEADLGITDHEMPDWLAAHLANWQRDNALLSPAEVRMP